METARTCLQSDVMLGYLYSIGISFKDSWEEGQKKQLLRIAGNHFRPAAASIRQNSYVLRKALELIAVADPGFVDFYTEYLTRVPEEKCQIKQAMFQFVVQNEIDDAKVAKFYECFFKASDLNKWIANALIARYGRGCEKTSQKKLAKLARTLTGAVAASDRTTVPPYLVVLLAELFGSDTENPLQEDKYAVKPAWQAVKNYLAWEPNEVFASAVVNIWNGVELTEAEAAAVQGAMMAGQQ